MKHLLTRGLGSHKVLLWSQRIGRLRPSPLQFGFSLSELTELTGLIELIRLNSVNSSIRTVRLAKPSLSCSCVRAEFLCIA